MRLATLADLDILVGEGSDFFADANPSVPLPSPGRLEAILRDALEHGVVAILEDSDYVGSIALAETSYRWSDERALCDVWFHVRRERRASRAAVQLVRFAVALSNRRGIPLHLGAGIGYEPQRLGAFYSRMGGELASVIYRWPLIRDT
jgi:hypothetical protein